jgi:predicted tellurium resistance membrane protein TerC
MTWITDPQSWISLITLTALEIVLGIDNIVFISILADRVEQTKRKTARQLGLVLAMLMRILLLFSLSWLVSLSTPIFSLFNLDFSARNIILIIGGLFLLGKSTMEIHDKLEGKEGHASAKVKPSLSNVVIQIMLLDIIFSLDSVITAVGMANTLGIMIAAVVIAVMIMLASVNSISDFINEHPTIKILALSFLLLIGFSLVAEGFTLHIPKGYIYFSMGFSILVEFLNMKLRQRETEPVGLRDAYIPLEKE